MSLFDERVERINIEDEIRVSYLDYAMSVIVGRALPDARDGLKPVHRRILHTMNEMGNDYNKPYKKSARIVGDVMGKYHPHGDQAIYDALVRLAQDFAMRYPLADGQGNFGSIDGDAAAAMRYTEIRMARLAHEFLADIDKKTVHFNDNYDGSMQEPEVLPTKVPGLLVNGSVGIAVGMATNIPPHNLGEVISGLIAFIENPEITIDELMVHIPGPDFPTGGFILGRGGIKEAYHTGRGVIRIRAKAGIESNRNDTKRSIVITEIPYQVNKSRLVEQMDTLVRDKRIEGISEIRDESGREGIRVVLDIKSTQKDLAETILNQLYSLSQLEVSFGINILAIVGKAPWVLTLKDALVQFLEHRKDVITRRTKFDLAKAEARAHILEGLRIALDNLDAVISLIRKSATPADAKNGLMVSFKLTEIQAQAILDLRLQRLTQLERQSIDDEYQNILQNIEYLKSILGSEALLLSVITEELTEIKNTYSDDRRTEITNILPGNFNVEDFIVDEDMVVTISHSGYIKRTSLTQYKAQRRGGRGVTAAATKDDDFVERMYIASTHSYLLFLTDCGRLYWLKVHEIPQASRTSRGKALVNVIELESKEKIATVLAVKDLEDENAFLVMATKSGRIKRVNLTAFKNPRRTGIIALTVNEGDTLVSAALSNGESAFVLSTRGGKAICFKEDDVRPMGRQAAGVKGITLAKKDYLVSMDVISADRSEILLSVTENGFGKRTLASEYNLQARGGQGTITIKTTKRNGLVVGVFKVVDDDHLMLITNTGRIIMFKSSEVSLQHRNTQGVKLIGVDDNEVVVDVAPVAVDTEADIAIEDATEDATEDGNEKE